MFSLKLNRSRPTALERDLGIRFKDRRLLRQALVHPSYLNENPEFALGSYERLEFLGDSVLDLAITRELFHRNPDLDEGQLTRQRSALVKGTSLARVARDLGLGTHLMLGKGEEANGGRRRESILAATLESVVGAAFVDRGYESARRLVLKVMHDSLEQQVNGDVPEDPKSLLQQASQRKGWGRPHYRTVKATGPDHARTFRVEVEVNGQVVGRGADVRKAGAETRAAQEGLRRLRVSP